MQVLQQTTQYLKDVETLQISNEAPVSQQELPIKLGLSPDSQSLSSPQAPSEPSHEFTPRFIAEFTAKFKTKLTTKLRAEKVKALLAAAFLVAVPVFIQAPLVRLWPGVSLGLTPLFLLWGWKLLRQPQSQQPQSQQSQSQQSQSQLWGDLVIGFSWTWLAGAIYWGWFRWDPYVHIPIESIGLPIVLILLSQRKAKIGNYFYLGSLLGTAITDLYFYCVGLIPYWRQLMIEPPSEAGRILHAALLRMETYQGVGSAIVLLALLIMLGTIPLRSSDVKWWAFSGAVLSTILVDSLFFVAAILS